MGAHVPGGLPYIPTREDLDRWEEEAESSASMSTWKHRFLLAMGWLRDAEKAPKNER